MTVARYAGVLVLLVAASALMGCTEPSSMNGGYTKDGMPGTPSNYVGIYRLAMDLHMTVVSTSTCHATLRGPSNLVVIYPDPNGQVFVNGKSIVASGGFFREGELLIPASVEQKIIASLVPEKDGSTPVVALRQDPRRSQTTTIVNSPRMAGGSVLIDPGHGGKDGGAHSVLGFEEKSVILPVALKVASDLRECGTSVSMTRDDDTFIDLHERPAISNRKRPDLFVSIHADSAERASADGFTVYVSRSAGANSFAAAQAIERSLRRAGFSRHGASEVEQANYVVLRENDRAAVLVELGYVSNTGDASRLRDPSMQQRYAHAIQEGIVDYLRSINATARVR